jgi:hypothetical protein
MSRKSNNINEWWAEGIRPMRNLQASGQGSQRNLMTVNPQQNSPEVKSECAKSSDVLSGWSAIVDGTMDNLALLCRSGIGFLDGSKVKGSISSDTKGKCDYKH